jgi:hypothetical protein
MWQKNDTLNDTSYPPEEAKSPKALLPRGKMPLPLMKEMWEGLPATISGHYCF